MTDKNCVSSAYDKTQAELYDQKRFTTPQGILFHEIENIQLKRFLCDFNKPGEVLEVGCGTGRFIRTVLNVGHRVVGIDPSPHMIEICKQKYRDEKRVQFDLGEGGRLPYADEAFDLVYSIRVMNQLESMQYAIECIKEMIRVTKYGGRILIEYCSRYRPRLKTNVKAVLLSRKDVLRVLPRDGSIRMIKFRGILFFSWWLLNNVPTFVLPIWMHIDRGFSIIFPALCSRCYITLVKQRLSSRGLSCY